MNEELKNAILRATIGSDYDADGDIVSYNGKRYYVNLFEGVVVRVNN